ncbi:hypothetical protein KC19_VG302700 [Ceratodon purpureus]|uniref:Uncharacterized protein n=1 Tax=Ceratodon purpureus TaxID=3225 RepID=A0A8T0HWZ9_CERPU|nr:hypothetical protein KC19_VG302700 [Ceratodon purpureus]
MKTASNMNSATDVMLFWKLQRPIAMQSRIVALSARSADTREANKLSPLSPRPKLIASIKTTMIFDDFCCVNEKRWGSSIAGVICARNRKSTVLPAAGSGVIT